MNQILTKINNAEVLDRFKTKIEDIQKLTNRDNLRDAIEAFKDKNIKHFEATTDQLCSKAVNIKIELNIHEISRGSVVQGFDQNNYKYKSEYLNSVISDKNIM